MWCVCLGCNYGSHVRAAEPDECVYKEAITDVHACHIQLLTRTSFSSLISSQHLLSYATSQEKGETNTTKVDER